VDCKVIYLELVWRNAERDRAEGVLGLRFKLVALSSSTLTRGYHRMRYDNGQGFE
jgi:hypothetical protein